MPSGDKGRAARDGSCVKCKWNAANPQNKSKCHQGHASDCPKNGVYTRQLAKKKEGNNRLKTADARTAAEMAATAATATTAATTTATTTATTAAAVEARAIAKDTQDGEEVVGANGTTDNGGMHPIVSCPKPWDELETPLQGHLNTLGFNRTKWMKKEELPTPATFLCKWNDIGAEAQMAAIAFGCNESSWNNRESSVFLELKLSTSKDDNDKEDSTFQRLCTHTELMSYYNVEFLKLKERVRQCLFTLGYNESKWQNHDSPPLCNVAWNALEDYEQVAASELGYTEQLWIEEGKRALDNRLKAEANKRKEEEDAKKKK